MARALSAHGTSRGLPTRSTGSGSKDLAVLVKTTVMKRSQVMIDPWAHVGRVGRGSRGVLG